MKTPLLFKQPKTAEPETQNPLIIPKIQFKMDMKPKLVQLRTAVMRFLLLSTGTIATSLIVLVLVNTFFESHYFSFQTPVVMQFQMPVLLHTREKELISPGVPTMQLKVHEEQSASTSALVIQPTVAEVLHISTKGIDCVNQNPGVASKIKAVFGADWQLAAELFCRESSLNPVAVNKSSGACGIVQALPCQKLKNTCPDMDTECQLEWGKDYISSRYGTIQIAVAFHDKHNWY